MNLTLYDISNQLQQLNALSESEEIPVEVLNDTLDGLQGTFEEKAIQVAKYVLSLEANYAAIYAAAKSMRDRGDRQKKKADQIKSYLHIHLMATSTKRIESPELTINRRSNPPALVIVNEHIIPDRFWIAPPVPDRVIDKATLKSAIKAGEVIDGAFVDQGERLEIKP